MYMGENFRFRMNPLRDFVYCTQFLQAEAMAYAYNCWRREFRGPEQEYCAGVLVWQLNDIWPGTSWALVDHGLQCKPAFFITKRALSKVVVGMERTVTKQPPYIVTGYPPEKHKLNIWAVNGTVQTLKVTLKLCAFDIQSGSRVALASELEEHWLELEPNRTTEVMAISIPNPDNTVVAAYLDDSETSERLARWISWPEPLRLLHLRPDLHIATQVADSGDKVLLSTNAPAKGVTILVPLSESGEDAVFEDNFVDLVPGETVTIGVSSLNGRKVQTRFLYDWEMDEGFEL
jgi:beta-mannosidase